MTGTDNVTWWQDLVRTGRTSAALSLYAQAFSRGSGKRRNPPLSHGYTKDSKTPPEPRKSTEKIETTSERHHIKNMRAPQISVNHSAADEWHVGSPETGVLWMRCKMCFAPHLVVPRDTYVISPLVCV